RAEERLSFAVYICNQEQLQVLPVSMTGLTYVVGFGNWLTSDRWGCVLVAMTDPGQCYTMANVWRTDLAEKIIDVPSVRKNETIWFEQWDVPKSRVTPSYISCQVWTL